MRKAHRFKPKNYGANGEENGADLGDRLYPLKHGLPILAADKAWSFEAAGGLALIKLSPSGAIRWQLLKTLIFTLMPE